MELEPGLGVGPYRLGTTLWDCMNHLKSSSTTASITWDDQSPNGSHILVSASPTASIRLLFSGSTQRLITCEVVSPSLHAVTWKGQPLLPADSDHETFKPQRMLHSKFGPTYPPTQHPAFQDELVLSYPGVCFSFDKDSKAKTSTTGSRSGAEAKESPLKRLLVSVTRQEDGLVQGFPNTSALEKDEFVPQSVYGDISHVSITLGDGITATSMLLNITSSGGTTSPVQIQLGVTTSEDLLCELGPPLRTFYKEDDRLSIHSHSSSTVPPNAYFFNYFSLGLDFLLDPDNHTVLKVLIHGNTCGEVLFGRYARCRWSLRRGGGQGEVTCEDEINNVKAFLSASSLHSVPASESKKRSVSVDASRNTGERTERAMVLDRTADSKDGIKLERPTDLLTFPGVILEVTRNEQACVETVWLV